jgi:hypothetical protein
MKRRWFLVEGIVFTIGSVATLFVFGLITPYLVLLCFGFSFAGILSILGGINSELLDIEWYQFVGMGNVVVGVTFALSILLPMLTGSSPYDGPIGAFMAAAAILGGGSLVFMGIDWLRGGIHYDLSSYEDGPIFTSTE